MPAPWSLRAFADRHGIQWWLQPKGPDSVRRLDDPAVAPLLTPSQGIHLVVDADFLPGRQALMIPETEDGRVMFAIPWLGKVLLGTTDTPRPDLTRLDDPQPLAAEIDFLFIDGNHEYDAVRQDFLDWAPKVKRGGIIALPPKRTTIVLPWKARRYGSASRRTLTCAASLAATRRVSSSSSWRS